MKKLLSLFGSMGLMAGAALPMMSFSNVDNQALEIITSVTNPDSGVWSNYTWVNATNGSDTVHKEWHNIAFSRFAPSYETIVENTKFIRVNGTFHWGLYSAPVSLSTLQLVEGDNPAQAVQPSLSFNYDKQNVAWNGWGHQQANITLKIKVYADNSGKALLDIDTWVAAGSQASVHIADVRADISSIEFVA